MANEFAPRKAEKSKVKLKIAIQGPSGSGKTWAALALASNMWPGAKICVIDTENESSLLYADRWEFTFIPLHPPFGTDRYIAAIDAAIDDGIEVLIIDSITAQWDGEGGILRRKEELDKRPGSNSYANWASFSPEHERFKQKLVQSPIHIIATMRSKQEYALQSDDKGKMKPVKLGLAPIQRDGMDFEFSQVWDIQMDHKAVTSKNRTALFDGEVVDLADPKVAKKLRSWLDSGKQEVPVAPKPQHAQTSEPKKEPKTEPIKGEVVREYVSSEEAREIQMAIKANGVDTAKFSEFLKRIGYQKREGVNGYLCIEKNQLNSVRQWLSEYKS
jgi:hypothetical protein